MLNSFEVHEKVELHARCLYYLSYIIQGTNIKYKLLENPYDCKIPPIQYRNAGDNFNKNNPKRREEEKRKEYK